MVAFIESPFCDDKRLICATRWRLILFCAMYLKSTPWFVIWSVASYIFQMKITLQELLANIEHRTQLLAEMAQQQKEASKHWHLSRGMGTNRYSNAPWWYRVYCYLWHQLIEGDGNVQLKAVPLPSNWVGGSDWNGWVWYLSNYSFMWQLLQTCETISKLLAVNTYSVTQFSTTDLNNVRAYRNCEQKEDYYGVIMNLDGLCWRSCKEAMTMTKCGRLPVLWTKENNFVNY